MPDGIDANLYASVIWAVVALVATLLIRLFLLDARLTGRWEGTLTCADKSQLDLRSHVFHFTMVLAKPHAGSNSGLLYYQRECTDKNQILRRGVDELSDYKRSKWSLITPQLLMQFTRRFHVRLKGDIDTSSVTRNFECRFEGIFSQAPILCVTTNLEGDHNQFSTWHGTLRKL